MVTLDGTRLGTLGQGLSFAFFDRFDEKSNRDIDLENKAGIACRPGPTTASSH